MGKAVELQNVQSGRIQSSEGGGETQGQVPSPLQFLTQGKPKVDNGIRFDCEEMGGLEVGGSEATVQVGMLKMRMNAGITLSQKKSLRAPRNYQICEAI